MKDARMRIASIVGAAMLLAGSCGLAAAQSSKNVKIRFAYQTSIAGGSLMVTEARGLWGVPVESKGFVAGSDVLQAVLAGSADAGSMATTPTIVGGRTGDFVIAAVANRVGDTTAIIVPPNSSIPLDPAHPGRREGLRDRARQGVAERRLREEDALR